LAHDEGLLSRYRGERVCSTEDPFGRDSFS